MELHAESDREAGAVFKRARVGDTLVNLELHLLLAARIVREHLLRKLDLRRGEDLAGGEVELDLVDLHVLPNEAEELVWEELRFGNVREVGLRGRARVQRHAFRGSRKAEVMRVLALTGLNLEPAAGGHHASDRKSFTDKEIVKLTCLRTCHRRRCVRRGDFFCESRGPCRSPGP